MSASAAFDCLSVNSWSATTMPCLCEYERLVSSHLVEGVGAAQAGRSCTKFCDCCSITTGFLKTSNVCCVSAVRELQPVRDQMCLSVLCHFICRWSAGVNDLAGVSTSSCSHPWPVLNHSMWLPVQHNLRLCPILGSSDIMWLTCHPAILWVDFSMGCDLFVRTAAVCE